MNKVRAKFKVQSVTKQAGWGGHKELHTVRLQPVTSGSEENKSFYASTPSGQIEIGVVSKEIGEGFEIGKEFYVDFIAVDAA